MQHKFSHVVFAVLCIVIGCGILGTMAALQIHRMPVAYAANTLPTVTATAFSPDGKLLVVGMSDGSIELIEPAGWKGKGRLNQKEHLPIRSLSFSPDSQRLAVGLDHKIEILNIRTRMVEATLRPLAQPKGG